MFCDGEQVAAHRRSWVKADVVLAAAHAGELRLARQAAASLAAGDIGDMMVQAPALAAYDELAG